MNGIQECIRHNLWGCTEVAVVVLIFLYIKQSRYIFIPFIVKAFHSCSGFGKEALIEKLNTVISFERLLKRKDAITEMFVYIKTMPYCKLNQKSAPGGLRYHDSWKLP